MLLTINEDRVPIKFILGVEKDLEGFPEPFDILHFYVNLSYRSPDRYKDTFTKRAVTQYHFKEASPEVIESSLSKLSADGYIEMTKDQPGKETYKILINPFEWLCKQFA